LYDLGNQLLKQRKYEQSLAIFTDLIDKEPNFAEGWNKRATLHFLMGNFNESIQDINKTLALEPRHFGALDGLGQIQFKLNNFYESIQTYEKLLTIVPHSSSAKKMLKLMNAQFI
jgi:tetratricopeptide (TPR) repeat protein